MAPYHDFGFFYLRCLWLNMRTGTLHLSGPLSKKWPRALISQLYLPPGWISGALLQMSLASLAGAPDRGLYHQAQDLLSCGLLEHRGRGRWQGAGWCRHLCHVWFSQVHRLCCCWQRASWVSLWQGTEAWALPLTAAHFPLAVVAWWRGGYCCLHLLLFYPGFSGLCAQLLWLVSWDCRLPLHCVSGSTSSVCSSLPIFRCTDMWNAPAPWCVGQRHLCWVLDVLLVVAWRGETESLWHHCDAGVTPPLLYFWYPT